MNQDSLLQIFNSSLTLTTHEVVRDISVVAGTAEDLESVLNRFIVKGISHCTSSLSATYLAFNTFQEGRSVEAYAKTLYNILVYLSSSLPFLPTQSTTRNPTTAHSPCNAFGLQVWFVK